MYMTIPIGVVINLVTDRSQDGWTLIKEELVSRRRASVSYRRIIRRDADGSYWEARYGLTPLPNHCAEYSICDGTLADTFKTYPSHHRLQISEVLATNQTTVVYVSPQPLERRYDANTFISNSHLGSNLQDPPAS